jgi:hypothetical protein
MAKSQAANGRSPDILLEVRPASVSGDLAPRVTVPEDFKSRAGEIAESIAEIAEHFRSKLGRILDKSDDSTWRAGSIEIEFDIAVQAEAGVVIAKATAGATFSARLVLQAPQDQGR